jgi:hypothetical protein
LNAAEGVHCVLQVSSRLAGSLLGGLGGPFGALIKAIPTGRKKDQGQGQGGDVHDDPTALAPGQFNPFGGAGSTGSGGVSVSAPGGFAPRQDQNGQGKPAGNDNSMTVNINGDGWNEKKISDAFNNNKVSIDRTRGVGPMG